MARSLKKGPYVFDRLLKKVQELNKSGKKEVIKHLQYITEKNLFQYM